MFASVHQTHLEHAGDYCHKGRTGQTCFMSMLESARARLGTLPRTRTTRTQRYLSMAYSVALAWLTHSSATSHLHVVYPERTGPPGSVSRTLHNLTEHRGGDLGPGSAWHAVTSNSRLAFAGKRRCLSGMCGYRLASRRAACATSQRRVPIADFWPCQGCIWVSAAADFGPEGVFERSVRAGDAHPCTHYQGQARTSATEAPYHGGRCRVRFDSHLLVAHR